MGIERWLEALKWFNNTASVAVKNVAEKWGSGDWSLAETKAFMGQRRNQRQQVRSELEDLFLQHFGRPNEAFREGTPEWHRAREALYESFNQDVG